MKLKSYVLLVGIVGSTLATLLLPNIANASGQGTNLTTSPVSVDLNGTPGKSVSTNLQVQNNESTAVPIKVELETFKAYGNDGQAQILLPTKSDTFLNWVQFSQTSFIAQPGAWNTVKMTINLPSTAALDYYYTVLFKPQVSNIPSHVNVLNGSNAILVLLNALSPNARPRLTVSSFSSNSGIYEYLPANFNVDVKNTGNVYLPPSGDVFISKSPSFSNTLASLNVNENQGMVLPGSTRVFKESWTDGFPVFTPKSVDGQPVLDKDNNPVYNLKWNFNNADKFRFGKYYAKLVLVYNNGTRDVPIQAVVSFWVIPWKLIGGIFILLALCAVGLYVSGHRFADRAFRVSKKIRRKS